MNISNLHFTNYIAPKNTTVFKGLWGESTRVSIHALNYTTYYYYPFSGETPKQIDKATKFLDVAGVWFDHTHFCGTVLIQPTLPFTENEYELFSPEEKEQIEKSLKKPMVVK